MGGKCSVPVIFSLVKALEGLLRTEKNKNIYLHSHETDTRLRITGKLILSPLFYVHCAYQRNFHLLQ